MYAIRSYYEHLDGICQSIVIGAAVQAEIIQGPQDVIKPPGWVGKQQPLFVDYFTGAVGTKQAVPEQEFARFTSGIQVV